MIAAFGTAHELVPGVLAITEDAVRAVHLTRIKDDGSGKAGGDREKIMIGRPTGSPIVLAPITDSLGLAISEGIEDALSAHAATGLGVWAAGSASHLPSLAKAVPCHTDIVTVVADGDDTGRRSACDLANRLLARGIEVEIVTAEHGSTAGSGPTKINDFNDILLKHGAEVARKRFDENRLTPQGDGLAKVNGDSGQSNGASDEINLKARNHKGHGQHAHKKDSKSTDPDPDLTKMNNSYAVVKVGGKTRVVSMEETLTYPGCKVPVYSSITDFCAFHANPKKLHVGENGKERKVGIGRWWDRSREAAAI
jgi:hypothetical protein